MNVAISASKVPHIFKQSVTLGRKSQHFAPVLPKQIRPSYQSVIRASSEVDEAFFMPAADLVIDKFISENQIIAVGTGVATSSLLRQLGQRLKTGKLKNVKIIPSSDVAASECSFNGLSQTSLEQANNSIDLFVDAPDELDSEEMAYIIGRGENGPTAAVGARIGKVKALASASRLCVAIAANSVSRLEGSIPVEIDADEWEEIAEELDDIFLGDGELTRRSLEVGANPRGGKMPVEVDGCNIIDIQFYGPLKLFGDDAAKYENIVNEIESVPGVVGCGLMANVAHFAVVVGNNPGEEPTIFSRASMNAIVSE